MVAADRGSAFLVSGCGSPRSTRRRACRARPRKLKTWAQALAAVVGGLAAAGLWDDAVAEWTLVVALVLTLISGLDYARIAPALLSGRDSRPNTADYPSGSALELRLGQRSIELDPHGERLALDPLSVLHQLAGFLRQAEDDPVGQLQPLLTTHRVHAVDEVEHPPFAQ